MRYKGLVSLHRYRQAFYDTRLNHAVRYARHALAIDENRASFACVPWDEERPRQSFTDQPNAPPRFRQVWFAGSHSDVGGSYPETEARLSDIALVWMVQEVLSLPHPIHIDASVLKLFPDPAGPQHDEREAFMAACPGWLVDMCLRVYDRRKFGWREGHRAIPVDALLHPSVLERLTPAGCPRSRRYRALSPARVARALGGPALLGNGCCGGRQAEGVALSRSPWTPHRAALGPREGLSAACGPYAATISSVWTLKLASPVAPKLVDRATSVASRPRAIRMRPMRGLLWRASKVYHCPPR